MLIIMKPTIKKNCYFTGHEEAVFTCSGICAEQNKRKKKQTFNGIYFGGN